jgi:hypothetical protein
MLKARKKRKSSRQEQDFYEAYGRALAEWAEFEYALSQLFAQVTDMHTTVAVRIFFSVRTSQARIDMLSDALPAQVANSGTLSAIKALLKKSGQYNATRNKLAHEYAALRVNIETGQIDHILTSASKLHDVMTRAEHLDRGITTRQLKEIEKSFKKLANFAAKLALGFESPALHAKYRDTILALPNLPYTPDQPKRVEAQKLPPQPSGA